MTLEKLKEREESLKKLLEQLVQQHAIITGQLSEIQYVIAEDTKDQEIIEGEIE